MNPVAPLATGSLGIYHLKRFWSYSLTGSSLFQQEWDYTNALLNTLGLGLEPTMQYLFSQTPDFETFEKWVKENGHTTEELIQQFNRLLERDYLGKQGEDTQDSLPTIFGAEALRHWEEEGYVILRNAVPKEDCAACVDLIYAFLDARPDDPTSWYKPHPAKNGIMVQLFNEERLNKNRASLRIQQAFQQLWGTTELIVSMDRVSFNPPETGTYMFPGPDIHWDVSLEPPVPFGIQGLLYLADTAENQGAFTLYPGFHKKVDQWVAGLPAGSDVRKEILAEKGRKSIAAKAGDFIFWQQALPHGSSKNHAQAPRIVQYINYQPFKLNHQQKWV